MPRPNILSLERNAIRIPPKKGVGNYKRRMSEIARILSQESEHRQRPLMQKFFNRQMELAKQFYLDTAIRSAIIADLRFKFLGLTKEDFEEMIETVRADIEKKPELPKGAVAMRANEKLNISLGPLRAVDAFQKENDFEAQLRTLFTDLLPKSRENMVYIRKFQGGVIKNAK